MASNKKICRHGIEIKDICKECSRINTPQDSWIENKKKEFDYKLNSLAIALRMLEATKSVEGHTADSLNNHNKNCNARYEEILSFFRQTLSDYKEQADDEILIQREKGIELGMNTMKDEVRGLIEGKQHFQKNNSGLLVCSCGYLNCNVNSTLSDLLNDDLLK